MCYLEIQNHLINNNPSTSPHNSVTLSLFSHSSCHLIITPRLPTSFLLSSFPAHLSSFGPSSCLCPASLPLVFTSKSLLSFLHAIKQSHTPRISLPHSSFLILLSAFAPLPHRQSESLTSFNLSLRVILRLYQRSPLSVTLHLSHSILPILSGAPQPPSLFLSVIEWLEKLVGYPSTVLQGEPGTHMHTRDLSMHIISFLLTRPPTRFTLVLIHSLMSLSIMYGEHLVSYRYPS